MPKYEFRCQDCRRRFELFFTYKEYDINQAACPHCHSKNVTRKIGRVRFARSDDSRLDDLSDSSDLEGLENDPKALGKMMRQMSSETGEEMGPEFDEVIKRLESGQSPEEIEQALPELNDTPTPSGGDLDDL